MLKVPGVPALVVLVLAVLPAVAAAAPPRSAQAYLDAHLRAGTAWKTKKADVRAGYEALPIEACRRLAERELEVPERAQERYFLVFFHASFEPVLAAMLPVAEQLQADLDAIRTRDPVLRTARARSRRELAALRRRPALDRPCEQLERWVDAGFPADAAPGGSMASLTAGVVSPREARREQRRDARVWRRIRRLGASRRNVERARNWATIGPLLPRDLIAGVFDFTTPSGKPI